MGAIVTKEMPKGPSDPTSVYQIKTHGGLGDIIWCVGKKLINVDKPIFVHISSENQARPRRSGIMVDHLPNVAGWRFDDATFCSKGQDWGPPTDPACAIDKTWEEIKPVSGNIIRLECNKHLESGRRIEEWLPDLPTTHHFNFLPPTEPAQVKLKSPYVIFHLAGWPDIPDAVLIRTIELFGGYVHVYIVGGSYDVRPRRLLERLPGRGFVSLLEDLAWPDLYALLTGALYCFGHASGFTAMADVLRVPGVVNNPRQHPRLLGTWNSDEHLAQVHCQGEQFEINVLRAYQALAAGGAGVWPPGLAAARATAVHNTPSAAVKAVAETVGPTTIAGLLGPDAPTDLVSIAVGVAYDSGRLPTVVGIHGGTADHVASVYTTIGRTTRPPAVNLLSKPTTNKSEPFELVIVWAPSDVRVAVELVRAGWRMTATYGTLIVVGSSAEIACRALGTTLKIAPAKVNGPVEAYYISRRV